MIPGPIRWKQYRDNSGQIRWFGERVYPPLWMRGDILIVGATALACAGIFAGLWLRGLL